jgi:ribose transport system permease protein
MAVASFTTNSFLTTTNLRNLVWEAVIVGIMAIGSTMVIMTAGIDLSPAAVLALLSMVLATLIVQDHIPLVLTLVLVLVLGTLLGAINGCLVAWGRLAPFIATLATMTAFQGVAYLFNNSTPYFSVSTALEKVFYGTFLGIALPVWYLVGLYAGSWALLRYTVLGRSIYAIGGNAVASRLSGINVRRTLVITYALAGLLAAICAILVTAELNSGSGDYGTSGLNLEAIAAAVIGGASLFGGTGNILLTLVGASVITVIENVLELRGVPSTWQDIAVGVIIILAVAIDSFRPEFARIGRMLHPHRGMRQLAAADDELSLSGAESGPGHSRPDSASDGDGPGSEEVDGAIRLRDYDE